MVSVTESNDKWGREKTADFSVLDQIYHTTCFQNSGVIAVGRKTIRVRSGGWLLGNSVLWTQQGIYELIAVATACTRPVQAQVRPNPSKERKAGHEEQLTIGGGKKGKAVFSKNVAPGKATRTQQMATQLSTFEEHKLVCMALVLFLYKKSTKLCE